MEIIARGRNKGRTFNPTGIIRLKDPEALETLRRSKEKEPEHLTNTTPSGVIQIRGIAKRRNKKQNI